MEKSIPKRVNSELSQSKFSVIGSFVIEFLFLPIQIIFVFSLLTFRPERLPNISSVFKADCNECRLASRKRVVSSANCVSLNSVPFMVIHIIWELMFINTAIISAPIKNKIW